VLNTKKFKTYLFIRRKSIFLIGIDFFIYYFSVLLINSESNNNILLTNIFIRYFPIWILINYLSNRYVRYLFQYTFKDFIIEFSKLLINNLFFLSIIYFSLIHQDKTFFNLINPQLIFILIVIVFLQSTLKMIFLNRKKDKKYLFISNYDKYLEICSEIQSVNDVKIDYMGYEEIFNIREIKNKYKVLVIDNLSTLREEQMVKLLKLKEKGILILNIFQFYDSFFQRYPSTILGKEILISKSFKNSGYLRFKRLGDLIFSILILLIFLPFGLITSLFILLEDGFPIFYKQVRTGHHGSKFEIFKFRTMKKDSEKDGPQWSSRNDKRITKFGKILRLTRIDEIPQLICVIKGQMSLIGPRPERPEMEITLEKKITSYTIRQTIKPGLSGWAQINYPYGASIEDSKNKLSYDLYYINKVSFLLDLIIFFKTIKLVLNANNAIPKK